MQVSIIIPTYNAAKFVGETIASALYQSEIDFEILLIDNNSTDNTLAVLQKWAEQHPGIIRIDRATTQGPSAARNRGIALARGEWIQFLDADDTLYPNKISQQIQLAGSQHWIAAAFTEQDLYGSRHDYPLHPDYWKGLANGTGIGSTVSNLFRKSALDAISGYDESMLTAEDHDLYFRLLKSGYLPLLDQEPRCLVHDRAGNKQSRLNPARELGKRIELHQRIHNYLIRERAAYYENHGDYLRAALLNHYRYWASFNREAAVISASEYFPEIGGLPAAPHGLMPPFIHGMYKFFGFKNVERLRSLLSFFRRQL